MRFLVQLQKILNRKEVKCGRTEKRACNSLLILVNALVFLVVEFTGGSEDTLHMLQCGAAYTPSILDGEYFRIFTCMFLHFGAKHLGNNMLVLFVLGGRMERTVGRIRYLLIYLLGGMGGNILCLLLEMRSGDFAVSAGASGPVFAIMGADDLCCDQRKGTCRRSFYQAGADHGSVFSLLWLHQ